MVSPVCSIFVSQLAARAQREPAKALWRDGWCNTFWRRSGAFGIRMSLVADSGQFRDPILERRIGGVDDAILDRLVEALQLRFSLGDALAKFGDVSVPTVIPFLPVLKHLIHHRRQALRIDDPAAGVGGRPRAAGT
jgi:hypothetical protein